MRPALPLYYYAASRKSTDPGRGTAAAARKGGRRRVSLRAGLFQLRRRPALIRAAVAPTGVAPGR
jgi:hypothetical protein